MTKRKPTMNEDDEDVSPTQNVDILIGHVSFFFSGEN